MCVRKSSEVPYFYARTSLLLRLQRGLWIGNLTSTSIQQTARDQLQEPGPPPGTSGHQHLSQLFLGDVYIRQFLRHQDNSYMSNICWTGNTSWRYRPDPSWRHRPDLIVLVHPLQLSSRQRTSSNIILLYMVSYTHKIIMAGKFSTFRRKLTVNYSLGRRNQGDNSKIIVISHERLANLIRKIMMWYIWFTSNLCC